MMVLCFVASFAAACNCGPARLVRVPDDAPPPAEFPELEPEPYTPPEPVDAGTVLPVPDAGQPPVDAGVVVPDAGVVEPVGCADGTREGFTSLSAYPSIAGCSGGWSVGGVTRADMAATCSRVAGNTSPNVEGSGCSAVDLCAGGWHLCRGKDEVAQKAPGGCGDAVPIGAPDKSLFFAVEQHSVDNTLCAESGSGDNDVFGCGNLGTLLTPAKGCGPLTRALASMSSNSCGFNEAEPNLGPWQCVGAASSHLHEGAIVTKVGCPGLSCSYDGRSVGNSDKGGVLCCRD
ncbi:MAG: hypothetical protein ACYC8T_20290 [Myxococcaceae bacterium]